MHCTEVLSHIESDPEVISEYVDPIKSVSRPRSLWSNLAIHAYARSPS